ncbi:hypothetical protein EON77_01600, partial [bacterium]
GMDPSCERYPDRFRRGQNLEQWHRWDCGLARHPGRVLTDAAILPQLWGHAYEEDTHTLRGHMGTSVDRPHRTRSRRPRDRGVNRTRRLIRPRRITRI